MYQKSLQEFFIWKRENGGFYNGYESDLNSVQNAKMMKYMFAGVGGVFTATVINPNFTKRRAWYIRKSNIALVALIGYQLGKKLESEKVLAMTLKMYDYLPLEMKRTLQTKDFRHSLMVDYRNPDRQLFDPETGKSLS